MAKNYVIGDLQGCYDSLIELLMTLGVTRDDQLWFVGDLVNRGPKSLDVLRFLYQERRRVKVVLGNHDVHLLRRFYLKTPSKPGDTLEELLTAEDRFELIEWLTKQPFLIMNDRWVMVHGGLHPFWNLDSISRIQGEFNGLFSTVEGRARFLAKNATPNPIATMITLRAVNAQGDIQSYKGSPANLPSGQYPWFRHPRREVLSQTIIFGHWSALGLVHERSVICLDTGCIWGGTLSAYCMEEDQVYQVSSKEVI